MKTPVIVLLFSINLLAITSEEILKKMDKVANYKTAKMDASMTIINKNGDKTNMKLTSFEQKEGDKSIMRFTFPSRLKGTAILSVEDNIWYYNRRTNRVRLLSRSAKKGSMMGSGFSYEDMDMDYEKDFTAEIKKETSTEYILKLVPKDGDKKFKYIIANVTKSNFIATSVEYYNKNDLKYKELTTENVKIVKGYPVPLKTTMKEIGSQKITVFEIEEGSIEYDLELKSNLFSHRHLKK